MSLEILNNPLIGNSANQTSEGNIPNITAPSFPVLKTPTELKQKTTQQIANTYYNGKAAAEGRGFKIYSDEPIFTKDIEEVIFYKNRFAETIGGIDVVLFASKNGAFLLQRYMEALPQSNELALFLEINDRFNYNTVLRCFAGAGLTNKKDIPFADILNFAGKHEVTITADKFKELIQDGIYRNKVSFISWFLGLKDASVGRIFDFFSQKLLGEAENFFEEIAIGISGLKVSENGWNPYPREEEYNPAFIPEALYKELKTFYEHTESKNPYENLQGQKQINSKIVKTLFEKINGAQTHFKNLLGKTEVFFPDFIYKKLNKALNLFFNQIDKMEKFLIDPMTGMQHIIYKNFQIANAFLCGIYNSIIDIIAGIFSVIGFIFKAVAAMENIENRKVEYGEMFLELMEDLIEGIMKFDYAGFFYQCITFQMKTIVRLVKWLENATAGFTLEKAAYYYGYIIGVLVDIIVETLLTGGAAAVAKLAKTLESFMLKPLEKITKAMSTAENLLTRVLEFIQMILREFKKGTKELFVKLEKFLNEVFGFGEEVADNALTPAEKRVKAKNKAQAERLERRKNRSEKKKQERELERRIDDLFDHLGGKLYNERELKLLKIQLKEKYGVELKFVDKDHSLNKKLKDWNKRGVVGSFTEGPPPSMFLRSDNASELTVFHEKVHLKVWFNKLDKMHIIDEEKLVWDAIWKTKDRWTNKELLDSYDYVNRLVYEANQKGKNFPYLDIPEVKALKLLINL
ncbi:hypothetical protein ACM39_02500 [Chryseobacterium sp. FH2]|uniref:hypothetical protein n=1 Tax=Chryseobacterium sp. FH2 TaxID=1674291 RepID=UPI00065A9A39|nr:hypothetical protein [Chryseobacterium sp. FH2]KMQ69930.1 hypothetical protein ACM39_02500 [Chryseobacterium sp. FH2]